MATILINEESLIRNLYQGQWTQYVKNMPSKYPETKYILKNLGKQLRTVQAVNPNCPNTDSEWCDEALKSHHQESLNGIIASKTTAKSFASQNQLFASVENLDKATWWANRSPSLRLQRTTQDYLKHLRLIFSHANSIMFIDPYVDPVKANYREFYQLLSACQRPLPPAIEIHLCHLDSISVREYENDFRRRLSNTIQSAQLTVNVFIWDKFHDRYLITNFTGIKLSNGFDVSWQPNEMTTWARLGRADRDDVQAEFDRATKRHKLQHQFTVS